MGNKLDRPVLGLLAEREYEISIQALLGDGHPGKGTAPVKALRLTFDHHAVFTAPYPRGGDIDRRLILAVQLDIRLGIAFFIPGIADRDHSRAQMRDAFVQPLDGHGDKLAALHRVFGDCYLGGSVQRAAGGHVQQHGIASIPCVVPIVLRLDPPDIADRPAAALLDANILGMAGPAFPYNIAFPIQLVFPVFIFIQVMVAFAVKHPDVYRVLGADLKLKILAAANRQRVIVVADRKREVFLIRRGRVSAGRCEGRMRISGAIGHPDHPGLDLDPVGVTFNQAVLIVLAPRSGDHKRVIIVRNRLFSAINGLVIFLEILRTSGHIPHVQPVPCLMLRRLRIRFGGLKANGKRRIRFRRVFAFDPAGKRRHLVPGLRHVKVHHSRPHRSAVRIESLGLHGEVIIRIMRVPGVVCIRILPCVAVGGIYLYSLRARGIDSEIHRVAEGHLICRLGRAAPVRPEDDRTVPRRRRDRNLRRIAGHAYGNVRLVFPLVCLHIDIIVAIFRQCLGGQQQRHVLLRVRFCPGFLQNIALVIYAAALNEYVGTIVNMLVPISRYRRGDIHFNPITPCNVCCTRNADNGLLFSIRDSSHSHPAQQREHGHQAQRLAPVETMIHFFPSRFS